LTSQARPIEDEQARLDALRRLEQGGVVILPTDTLYGLSAAASSRGGVRRIRRIKRTDDERLFIVLASSIEMVETHVRAFGCTSHEALALVWPAPMTAILPAGSRKAEWMGETVAIRVPDVPPLLEIIAGLGEPIVSTSVNRGGNPPMTSLEDIERDFGDEVDMIVSYRDAGKTTHASTIVDFTGDEPAVVRRGDYHWPPGR
jgi:L-threonylcarbamoyladenylate synthase